jgi:hypothetical protein
MSHDPIVDEVRRAREQLMAECDDDLDKLVARIRSFGNAHGGRYTTADRLRGGSGPQSGAGGQGNIPDERRTA